MIEFIEASMWDVFESLHQVREITRAWITEYNEERPHDSLGKIPPAMFRRQVEKPETPLLNCVIDGEAYGVFGLSGIRSVSILRGQVLTPVTLNPTMYCFSSILGRAGMGLFC